MVLCLFVVFTFAYDFYIMFLNVEVFRIKQKLIV